MKLYVVMFGYQIAMVDGTAVSWGSGSMGDSAGMLGLSQSIESEERSR
jgi:hypothetical protein